MLFVFAESKNYLSIEIVVNICILGTPLLLYMQNTSLQASALFYDATIDLLLADGCKLIGKALQRLGLTTVDSPRPSDHVQPTSAYLIQSSVSAKKLLWQLSRQDLMSTRSDCFVVVQCRARGVFGSRVTTRGNAQCAW